MAKVQTKLLRPVYINAAFRSPIGRFGGSLKHLSAGQLAAKLLKSAIAKSKTSEVDSVFLGHARQAGAGPNTARQATIFSGLNENIPAYTLNQACASGLTAIMTGVDKIQLGQAEKVWAGGVESMSNTPYLLANARWGQRLGNDRIIDGMYQDGFFCPMSDMVMGQTVENNLVREFKISRKEQDEYALKSQLRAKAAIEAGLYNDEILSIAAEGKNEGLEKDEHVRFDSSAESLSTLAPVFNEKGTITAGNSSGITDGASWLLLSSKKNDYSMVEVLGYSITALAPQRMGLGPVSATQDLLSSFNVKMNQLAAVELNEAFAAQVIACQRTLKISEDKLNPRGGAIALGHPIGATGARITTTLVHQIKASEQGLGLATLCVSGGMGFSLLLRAV